MQVRIHSNKSELGRSAAAEGIEVIKAAIAAHGQANIILATGASQFEMLSALIEANIDWSCVTAFHLDEYVGLDDSHPASFRRYLRERFLDQVDPLRAFTMIAGNAKDPLAEVKRLNGLIANQRIDVCFAGIGENCHLAFNDPPADFDTKSPYIVVDLDAACRRQQLGEGWFETLEAVPHQAISMSINQILKCQKLILSVADTRKATAVRHAVEGPVTPAYPASIVQRHDHASLHLDAEAASELSQAETTE